MGCSRRRGGGLNCNVECVAFFAAVVGIAVMCAISKMLLYFRDMSLPLLYPSFYPVTNIILRSIYIGPGGRLEG